MSTLNGGPGNIVTSGLVLYLDAANYKSYTGTGTSWNDLYSTNNVTLTNGPTFNSSNLGSIVLDGSNDYADFFAPNLSSIATVELWAKIGAAFSNKMFFGWNIYDIYCRDGCIGYNTGNGDCFGIDAGTVSSLGVTNNWKHYVFEMRTDVSYSSNKIYINSISQTVSQVFSTEAAGNRNFNSGNGRLAGWRYSTGYHMPMNCASFRVYNRVLTAQEVLQNYNATKTRFGL
jgi:hypothetical protein